ncbi:hypothetical protein BUALT_Bualt02G0055400 [Buddleja alternifolia]|uniref:Uncharacterized protein n=1 Tax=Buddleja alternifolia TaxID=168488 RepID=A0AAV6Y4E7_9LAMI|nr:hypothetical protein BUALT_Bualt02G0055400 [Buddleja alternifolia]
MLWPIGSQSKVSCGGPKKGVSTKRSWSQREEEVLISALKDIIAQGWKATMASRLVTSKSLNITCGIGWNDTTKMVEANDDAWDGYVKTDSNARLMHYKSWPLYDDWVEIFGKDRATGEQAEDFVEAVNHVLNETNHCDKDTNHRDKDVLDGLETINEGFGGETETMSVCQPMSSVNAKKKAGKKRKSVESQEPMYELLGNYCKSTDLSLPDFEKVEYVRMKLVGNLGKARGRGPGREHRLGRATSNAPTNEEQVPVCQAPHIPQPKIHNVVLALNVDDLITTLRISHLSDVYAKLPEQKKQNSARLFSLREDGADATHDVVTGTITIQSVNAFVLFDSGASHSFISKKFAACLNCISEKLDEPLHVSTPMKNLIIADKIQKNCIIGLGEKHLKENLIRLDMSDFDAILYMDWLSFHHAHIDCFGKKIVFKVPREKDFVYRDHASTIVSRHTEPRIPIIFSINAFKALRKGSMGYLAHVSK